MILGLDWDGTLVDAATQEWLPGAREALKRLTRMGHRFVILSARAGWDGGRDQIRSKLASAGYDVEVYAKPRVDVIVDNNAIEFTGDWSQVLSRIRTR